MSVQVLDVIFLQLLFKKLQSLKTLDVSQKFLSKSLFGIKSEGNSFFGQSTVHGAHMGICCHSNDTALDSLAFHLFFSV